MRLSSSISTGIRMEGTRRALRRSAWVRPLWRNQSFRKVWRSSSCSVLREALEEGIAQEGA